MHTGGRMRARRDACGVRQGRDTHRGRDTRQRRDMRQGRDVLASPRFLRDVTARL